MTTTFIETLIRKMHLDDSRIITLTGAGGKTTLLYALTGYLSRTENTLLTTTTHIMEPRDLPNAILVTREDAAALRAAFLSSRLAALGIPVSGPSGAAADGSVLKWHAPSLSFLEEIRDIPARIVCEGDGSRRMPVKIPRPGEPVLYPGTDTVIGVIGLSCLGQPASECLFGRSAPGDHTHMTGNVFSAGMADNLQDHLGSALRASGGRITPDILAQIALSGQGLRKGITTQHYHVLFNQADCLDMTALRAMQETAQKIRDNGTDCHIVSLKHHIFY
ncbi:MAG: putative selenium-dependent hydroxylase accessory protein YqeC [Clostridiales bacterium]|nr:putative selenium-dependent hydroxylase accessory protein YqeC [Clostridiales bacterium]